MKLRLIIACLGFLSLASATIGQSFFELRNLDLYRSEGDVDAPVFDAEGVPLTGTNCVAELWGSASPESLQPLPAYDSGKRALAYFYTSWGQTPGYFWGGIVVANVQPLGGWAWLQVRAWDIRQGPTYEEVSVRGLGGYGESPLFYAQGSPGPFCDPPCIPAALIGLQSFKLRAATAVLMRKILRQDNQVVIEWFPGFKQYQLQDTSDLRLPWQNVGGQTTLTSATNVIGSSMRFFRVIGFTQ